jgi:hypothetical protein
MVIHTWLFSVISHFIFMLFSIGCGMTCQPMYLDGNPVISIQGHPITLVCWPKVYHYWKQDQWKGTKAKWFEWKVCVSPHFSAQCISVLANCSSRWLLSAGDKAPQINSGLGFQWMANTCLSLPLANVCETYTLLKIKCWLR